ncbi:MAG: FAD-binding oxidoreductase [Woeseiaceae bacterium]|nr:FAD-binding oxidoreductase [Woeseiaceae bacterium]
MQQPQEHPRSYYAASANWRTDYAPLRGEHRCDVAVVGAGFTGLSAALGLAERGYDVALLEANRVGWGASGRNGGQLIDGFVDVDKMRNGSVVTPLAWSGKWASNAAISSLTASGGTTLIAISSSAISISPLKTRKWIIFAPRSNASARSTIRMKCCSSSRMHCRATSGRSATSVVCINRGNGHLHPLNLCLGEARALEQLGASIFEQTPVTRVHHGTNPRVETPDGIVHAKSVVLAGNAYLGRAERRLFGAVIPSGSYVIATEPLSAELASELLPEDMAACDQRVGLDYFRLSADKRMLFGGLCNYSGRDPRDITATLRPNMVRAFPQLADAKIDFEWGGYIAISINRIPQFGRIEGNTWYAQGYSGHGLAPSHMAGTVLADAIAGTTERFDVFERIRHLRLPGGKWFANPALALGMMYYRLKEIL